MRNASLVYFLPDLDDGSGRRFLDRGGRDRLDHILYPYMHTNAVTTVRTYNAQSRFAAGLDEYANDIYCKTIVAVGKALYGENLRQVLKKSPRACRSSAERAARKCPRRLRAAEPPPASHRRAGLAERPRPRGHPRQLLRSACRRQSGRAFAADRRASQKAQLVHRHSRKLHRRRHCQNPHRCFRLLRLCARRRLHLHRRGQGARAWRAAGSDRHPRHRLRRNGAGHGAGRAKALRQRHLPLGHDPASPALVPTQTGNPEGLVYVGLAVGESCVAYKYTADAHIPLLDRAAIRMGCVRFALEQLRNTLPD